MPSLHSPQVSDTVEANVARTRQCYEEWNAEGLPGFERVWAPDIVLHEAPEFPETGVFRGAAALADHVRGLLEGGGTSRWWPSHWKVVATTCSRRWR